MEMGPTEAENLARFRPGGKLNRVQQRQKLGRVETSRKLGAPNRKNSSGESVPTASLPGEMMRSGSIANEAQGESMMMAKGSIAV